MEPTQAMPGVFALIKQSLSFYKANYKKFINIGLVLIGVYAAIQVANMLLVTEKPVGGQIFVSFLVIFITSIIGTVFQVVQQYVIIKEITEVDSGRNMSVSDLYKFGFGLFFPALWISILTGLILLGTSVFLLIPALVLGIFLTFSGMVLVAEDKRGLTALSTSFYYIRNNFWKVLGRLLAFALISVGILLLLLGVALLVTYLSNPDFFSLQTFEKLSDNAYSSNIWAMLIGFLFSALFYCVYLPIVQSYNFAIYKHLKVSKPVPNPEVDFKKSRGWFLGLSIFGFVVPILAIISILSLAFAFGIKEGFTDARNTNLKAQAVTEDINASFATTSTVEALVTKNPSLLESPARGSDSVGFEINIPKGWTLYADQDDLEQGSIISFPEDPNNAIIQIQKFPLELASDAVAADAFQVILASNPDLKNILTKKAFIGTQPAYVMTSKDDTGTVGFAFYLIARGKETFGISVGWNADSIVPNVESLLNESISTFKVL
ncbi:MAG: hypothetical protein QG640_128 [Patescibacteria group bacterium]|nr:hypothetical protein [Patescibacteria group bacterium]